MGLCKVLILAADHAYPIPEVFSARLLRFVVLGEAHSDIVTFTQIDLQLGDVFRVQAGQKIYSGASGLGSFFDQIWQAGTGGREDMAGSVHYFCSNDTRGSSINKKHSDCAALGHSSEVAANSTRCKRS
jgi:hypothetical protein